MDPVGMVKELSPIADVEYEGEEDSYGGVCVGNMGTHTLHTIVNGQMSWGT